MQTLHDLFARVAHQHFKDTRSTFAALQLHVDDGSARVTGSVLDHAAAAAFMDELREHAPHVDWRDATTPLVGGPQHQPALITRAVVDVRAAPSHKAERVTQALWGQRCEMLQIEGTWAFVRMDDGYLGWMDAQPLRQCSSHAAQDWTKHATHMVRTPLAPVYTSDEHPPQQCALLPFGVRVAVATQTEQLACIRWPDGSERWIDAAALVSLIAIPQQSVDGLRSVVRWLPTLIGVPYLWGGKTPFGYDCSGLTQTLYNLVGVRLPRDADQQCATGRSVPLAEVQRGDLLFFDTDTPAAELPAQPPKITHVAFALDRDHFIHASRGSGGVGWGSFDPVSPHFLPGYQRCLVGVRRYLLGT
jgi:cell wall-associated NlpC family hydrolase